MGGYYGIPRRSFQLFGAAAIFGRGLGLPDVAGVLGRERLAGLDLRLAAGAARLPGGHEVVLAAADQVHAAHPLERRPDHRPVVRVVPPEEGLVEPALLHAARDVDL